MPILPTKHGKRGTSSGTLGGGDVSRLSCFVGRIAWRMHMQWLPGSLSPSPKRAWDEAKLANNHDNSCIANSSFRFAISSPCMHLGTCQHYNALDCNQHINIINFSGSSSNVLCSEIY